MKNTFLSTEFILAKLTEIGKSLSERSQTNYWSTEDHDRAAHFVKPLNATRRAYAEIRAGHEPLPVLGALYAEISPSIEGNGVRLMISALKGEFAGKSKGWVTADGELKYISETRKK